MTAGAAFVTTVQTVVGLKAGWASTDVLAAAVVMAARLAEEDVPRGTARQVARAAVELVDFAIATQHRPLVRRPEWMPDYLQLDLTRAA